MNDAATRAARVSPRAAFMHRDFRLYQASRFLAMVGMEMLAVAVSWQVYDITHRAVDLGYVGLVQFFPSAFLSLASGHVADRFDRKRIIVICYVALAVSAGLLVVLASIKIERTLPIYGVLLLVGIARAFANPAGQALMPSIVPMEHFSNAVAWSSSIWQMATIVGPSLGGFLYASSRGPVGVYVVCTVLLLVAAACMLALAPRKIEREPRAASWQTVLAGVRYVWEHKIVLGAISLDLFAVLLGGATALLPAFAKDILMTGPWGLGVLRSAPAVGAAFVGILLAYRPIQKNAGAIMLWCVAIFGVATIVFGYSRSFWLSLAALVVIGASDMVSVAVRLILVQLATPPEMRGRVGAVNMVFVGASNELGGFESGVTGQWFGVVRSVIYGGIGTIAIVAAWAMMFPSLRKVSRLEEVHTGDS